MLNDLHNFIRGIIKKNYGGSLSPYDIDRSLNRASTDLFNELVSIYRETDRLPDLLKTFKSSATVTLTAGAGTISGAAGAEIISAANVVGSTEHEAFIAKDDKEWVSRSRSMLERHGVFDENLDHIFIDRADLTLPATNTEVALPEDFVEDLGTIYYQSGSTLYEGQILSHREFLNRVNSSILSPDSTNPIATIYGNKIELYPTDPVNPQTFVLPYYRFPVENNPLVRFVDDGTDIDVTVKPSSISSIEVYYLSRPVEVQSAYTVSNGNVTLITPITDFDWPAGAMSELANRALTYLSFPIKDTDVAQLEKLVESMNQQQ